MAVRNLLGVVTLSSAVLTTAARAQAPTFSDATFEINRDRVKVGSLKTCAKSDAFLVPTTYLYITIRNDMSAGGGLGNAKSKARVFVEGLTKEEVQGLAAQVHDEIVNQMRAAGLKVLTFDDAKGDVADVKRLEPNERYGMPTHDIRVYGNMDFITVTPNDEQALAYGGAGPQANYFKAGKRLNATLLMPEITLTLPQLGATASRSEMRTFTAGGGEGVRTKSSAKINFDPSMHLASIAVSGMTPKGSWCTIGVPEHTGRMPAKVAGDFKELSSSTETHSAGVTASAGEWQVKSGDYTFVVDHAAFSTGVLAVGKSLGKLMTDAMTGKY